MVRFLKIFSVVFLILAAASISFLFSRNMMPFGGSGAQTETENASLLEQIDVRIEEEPISEESMARLEEKAKEALAFCKTNGCSTDFCILVDMKIHSGKYRLFVYDFNKGEIERMSLCAHGSGKGERQSTGDRPLFGNIEGSLLTSLGKYRTGIRAYSNWGINVHYKLHGLEESNSNAFKRVIVLHSYSEIPPDPIYPHHLPMGWSWGCPVVDDETMRYLDTKLGNSKRPALLWIYY